MDNKGLTISFAALKKGAMGLALGLLVLGQGYLDWTTLNLRNIQRTTLPTWNLLVFDLNDRVATVVPRYEKFLQDAREQQLKAAAEKQSPTTTITTTSTVPAPLPATK